MKKYLFIIIWVLLFCNTFAQDLLNPPKLSIIDTCSIINRSSFFVKGWNWGQINSGLRLDTALSINFYHANIFYNQADNATGANLAAVVGRNIIGGRNNPRIFNAHCLHLEPALEVNSTSKFRPKYGDNSGAVFGFRYRNFSVGDTLSFPNLDYSRFSLNCAGITNSVKVLDSVWDGTILRCLDYDGPTSNFGAFSAKNRIWG